MINVCQEFIHEYDVVFDPQKTACMLFGCKTIPNDIVIYLGEKKLRWVDSFRLLGNIVTPDLKDEISAVHDTQILTPVCDPVRSYKWQSHQEIHDIISKYDAQC